MGERTLPKGTLRMCVDKEEDGIYSGRIYTKFRKEEFPFHNMGEILLIGEKIFNEAGFPMAFQEKRTFVKNKTEGNKRPEGLVMTDQELRAFRGKIYTADIIVTTRRRCGWQGMFSEESGRQEPFGSEMQLLELMVKALKDRDPVDNVLG
ncbi:MAG TPA: hypothetical protein IAB84_12195 [Candidatus Choladousia intestinigallinarum]|nr:hypothetical protein [Candidatus Choladousia intestinigallinarum]